MCRLCAEVKTKINSSENNKLRKKTTIVANTMDFGSLDISKPEAWDIPHPQFEARIAQYKQRFYDTKDRTGDKWETISFGDSLMDGWTKPVYTSVEEYRNCNIGGSWASHMQQVYEVMIPYIYNLNIRIKNIIIGTLGGNPLLSGQPVGLTIKKSVAVLSRLRELAPTQRIIVYGIPPTVSVYATQNAPTFETGIYQWVLNDGNSVFLPLQKKFAKWLIFPKATMNADGVHFTENGVYEFDGLLNAGKTAMAGSIVD